SGTRVTAKNLTTKPPVTSTLSKSNRKSSGKTDPELSAILPAVDLEGRGDKAKGTSEKIPVCSRSATTQVPSQPQMYDPKKTQSEVLDDPLAFVPSGGYYRDPGRQEPKELKISPTSRASEPIISDRYKREDGSWANTPVNVSTIEKERQQPDIASQVKEAIASGLEQTNASFQKKMDLLQEVVEASNRKTERAVGQVCESVNRVKINLEIVDSTLETMNSRLLEFQKGVKSGLKELTQEVGNLASSLAKKDTDNQEDLDDVCADNR
ncbi:uncharacterized protein, partial [Heptranchias perlo]|uniref:uncharacterized protein n=1 Tax=Heptranchias perlo TaxID=212740 RepID=UPI00355A35B3